MSQKYRFKSLEIAEKEKEQLPKSNTLTVFDIGETRTIDFVLLDGTRQNFAYANYLTAWLGMDGDDRVIKIFFATHLVTIKGYCLDDLYDELVKLSVKSIKAHDERYGDMVEEDKAFVKEIKITWKKEQDEMSE